MQHEAAPFCLWQLLRQGRNVIVVVGSIVSATLLCVFDASLGFRTVCHREMRSISNTLCIVTHIFAYIPGRVVLLMISGDIISMARNSLLCADVPLRNYSLTDSLWRPLLTLAINCNWKVDARLANEYSSLSGKLWWEKRKKHSWNAVEIINLDMNRTWCAKTHRLYNLESSALDFLLASGARL